MLAPIHCEECDEPFIPGNQAARKCSARCRMRAYRRRHAPDEARRLAIVQELEGADAATIRDRMLQPDAQSLFEPVLLGALLGLASAVARP